MSLVFMTDFMRKIDRAYTAVCKPVYEKFRISKTSFDIIMFLANNPENCTAGEISAIRNIKPNVVSLHVEELVKDGYLDRQAVPEDRRKVRLELLQKADPIINEGRDAQDRFHRSLSEGLCREDLEALRHCFEVIASNADRIDG